MLIHRLSPCISTVLRLKVTGIVYGLQHGTRNLISLQVQCKTCRDKYGSRILKRGDLDKDWNGIGKNAALTMKIQCSSKFGPGHPASP